MRKGIEIFKMYVIDFNVDDSSSKKEEAGIFTKGISEFKIFICRYNKAYMNSQLRMSEIISLNWEI